MEKNHDEYGFTKHIRLMKSQITIRYCIVRRIIRFHEPNKVSYQRFTSFVFQFRDEKEL